VFKAGMVVMAPDGDPEIHRASIKTSKLELTVALCQLFNFDQLASVCRDMVQNDGVQSLILCPGCTHEAVARVVEAIGPGIAVNVARGDIPSVMATADLLGREGWFPAAH
jgi:hypothetical protein